ncbi:SRPBCC family protein [Caenimonas soli]|uniref:SRPBCC family protein n=1 Tax=Caenimonas soli TaxID=2735555 RepID=UPI001553F426|nr:SRPBCC family protein [Caenimonas soli]NPC55724.1 SRPBCC family protein [Caenimonas soli]
MIKTIALIAVAAMAVPLVLAAFKPDTFRVHRSASIKAPPERLYPLINDMRVFNTWNPYNLKDPNIRGEYSGPQAGPGAAYHFAGNKDVGKGSISILESTAPAKVTMKLDMLEPFEGHNIVEFTMVPRGDATEVTWAMHGPSPFMAKLVGIFMNMDRMIGRDFEAGLANLKARAEKAV